MATHKDNGEPPHPHGQLHGHGQHAHREVIQAPLPNPSLQVTADHQLKAVEAPVYAPGPGEVLVHVKTTGLCGSDVHFWKAGRIGSLVVAGDAILGHEAAGVVVRCGAGVAGLAPGDRVAIEPGVPCGACFLCRAGRYNLCGAVRFAGVYPDDGTLQRYKVHPAAWLHRVPDALTLAEAALLEPLGVALQALRAAGLALGRGAVVCGAGPIGLTALLAARASGAHPLVVTDVEPRRLAFARRLVPSCLAYEVDARRDPRAHAAGIRALFLGAGGGGAGGDEEEEEGGAEALAPPCVIECTGVEASVCTAAFAVRRGGRVVVVGVGRDTMDNLPFMHLSLAEIELRFINRYTDTWPAGIACMTGGIIDMKKLVTHEFPLEKALEGLTFSSDPKNGSIKVHIVDEAETVFF